MDETVDEAAPRAGLRGGRYRLLGYCPASTPYFTLEGMLVREHLAGCKLPPGHDGNHLAEVDGKPRVFRA